MPRYLGIVVDAGQVIRELLATVPVEQQPDFAVKLGKLYNLGIRTAPRAVQSTVRKNAVAEALRGLPVRVGMTPVTKPKRYGGGMVTFNALTLTPVGGSNTPTTEGDADEDGE
jgi:hypothetical protein